MRIWTAVMLSQCLIGALASGEFVRYVCTGFCGGWADRLKGILTSAAIADARGVPLEIDMRHGIDLERFYRGIRRTTRVAEHSRGCIDQTSCECVMGTVLLPPGSLELRTNSDCSNLISRVSGGKLPEVLFLRIFGRFRVRLNDMPGWIEHYRYGGSGIGDPVRQKKSADYTPCVAMLKRAGLISGIGTRFTDIGSHLDHGYGNATRDIIEFEMMRRVPVLLTSPSGFSLMAARFSESPYQVHLDGETCSWSFSRFTVDGN